MCIFSRHYPKKKKKKKQELRSRRTVPMVFVHTEEKALAAGQGGLHYVLRIRQVLTINLPLTK